MPAWHRVTVSATQQIAPGLVRLEVDVPTALVQGFHTPGQYHRLRVDEAGEAFFAMASAPGQGPFEYLVKAAGTTAEALAALGVGAALEASDVEGAGFPLERARGHRLFLVGTGTGFAPLRSTLLAIRRRRGDFGEVRAAWGISSPDRLVWGEELSSLRAARLDVQVIPLAGGAGWAGPAGMVQDVIATWPEGDAVAFLAGQPEMVKDVTRLLSSRGVPADRVFLNY